MAHTVPGASRSALGLLGLALLVSATGCPGEPDPDSGNNVDPGLARLTAPPALASHVMSYHNRLEQVVLFGGSDPERNPTNLLWGWDGTKWKALSRRGPAPRLHAGMAYDWARHMLVVHGGLGGPGKNFGDTWEWDSNGPAWAEVASGESGAGPGSRDHHALAYDPISGSVLLFGGQDEEDRYPTETWAWDGESWTMVASEGPPPRSTHRMAWDPIAQQVVLFGGWGPDGQLADTWVWNGESWSDVTTPGPSARGATRSASLFKRGELLLFGGLVGKEPVGDTWTRKGGVWTELTAPGPSPRNVHGMAYDLMRKRAVLYGGIGADGRLDDTWEWDGERWERIAPEKPLTEPGSTPP